MQTPENTKNSVISVVHLTGSKTKISMVSYSNRQNAFTQLNKLTVSKTNKK